MSIIKQLDMAEFHIRQAKELLSKNERLSVTDAAELAGMPRDTLYHYIRTGRVPAEKLGKHWYVMSQVAQNISNYIGDKGYADKE